MGNFNGFTSDDDPVYYSRGKQYLSDSHQEKCWCRTCRPITMGDMRFVVCPDCGNKRCPKANDHRHACSGSNEPGKKGSAYQYAPKE